MFDYSFCGGFCQPCRAEKDYLPALVRQLLDIWDDSVRATHTFLSEAEILRTDRDEEGGPYPLLYMKLG